jgi:hypothetical protein
VLPPIIPKAEALVEARLTEPRVAAHYLDRAAKAQPFDFAEKLSNDDQDMARRNMTRQLFTGVIAKAYGVIARQPEFAAEMLRHTLAELLQGQDALRDEVGALGERAIAAALASAASGAAAGDARLARSLVLWDCGDLEGR